MRTDGDDEKRADAQIRKLVNGELQSEQRNAEAQQGLGA